ncbi:hypothetical protein J6590_052445 [Homalodisca vitripennis]|nr:hypothetical protein J6590_052445 [Homalodisca vitripennis]
MCNLCNDNHSWCVTIMVHLLPCKTTAATNTTSDDEFVGPCVGTIFVEHTILSVSHRVRLITKSIYVGKARRTATEDQICAGNCSSSNPSTESNF